MKFKKLKLIIINQLIHNTINMGLYLICLGSGEYFISKMFAFQMLLLIAAAFIYSYWLATVFMRNYKIINDLVV